MRIKDVARPLCDAPSLLNRHCSPPHSLIVSSMGRGAAGLGLGDPGGAYNLLAMMVRGLPCGGDSFRIGVSLHCFRLTDS